MIRELETKISFKQLEKEINNWKVNDDGFIKIKQVMDTITNINILELTDLEKLFLFKVNSYFDLIKLINIDIINKKIEEVV